ncbi:MAG: LacI family transcriptional regulator [Firmicutes bacterium]|nr:LacI family transcriptional regulator [Bacillota bacterium]
MSSIHDVAQAAGVSISTVSRVLTNSAPVASETRSRVLEAVSRVGYRPNRIARALRRGTSQMLGLVLPDITNPFFTEVAAGVQTAAERHGYAVFLAGADGSPKRQAKLIRALADRQVDGMILCPVDNADPLFDAASCDDHGVRCVLIDRGPRRSGNDVVTCDNYGGSLRLTRHLIELGHTRLGCIAGPKGLGVSQDRVRGFRDAMREFGLAAPEGSVYHGSFSAAAGEEGAASILRVHPDTTALFCLSDWTALGALAYLSKHSIPVPGQVSVAGFDNIHMSSLVHPALTTVDQPKREMGQAAVRLLLERISGRREAPKAITLPSTVILRDSTGPPPVS